MAKKEKKERVLKLVLVLNFMGDEFSERINQDGYKNVFGGRICKTLSDLYDTINEGLAYHDDTFFTYSDMDFGALLGIASHHGIVNVKKSVMLCSGRIVPFPLSGMAVALGDDSLEKEKYIKGEVEPLDELMTMLANIAKADKALDIDVNPDDVVNAINELKSEREEMLRTELDLIAKVASDNELKGIKSITVKDATYTSDEEINEFLNKTLGRIVMDIASMEPPKYQEGLETLWSMVADFDYTIVFDSGEKIIRSKDGTIEIAPK